VKSVKQSTDARFFLTKDKVLMRQNFQ